jgi:carbonic anhydrase/acetyltransferase-like protein (isoleucine patch superfamily)
MLAARGLLSVGKRIGRQELWMGSPAKLARVMSDEESAKWDGTVPHYVGLAEAYRRGLRAIG